MTRACIYDISKLQSDKHSTENQKFKIKELDSSRCLTPIIILMPSPDISQNRYTIKSCSHSVLIKGKTFSRRPHRLKQTVCSQIHICSSLDHNSLLCSAVVQIKSAFAGLLPLQFYHTFYHTKPR